MLEYPINAIKDSARPSYWVPDDEINNCFVCDRPFDKGNSMSLTNSTTVEGQSDTHRISSRTQNNQTNSVTPVKLHHCRKCGRGVCDECSKTKKPVPIRGWDQPVRVCDKCCAEELKT